MIPTLTQWGLSKKEHKKRMPYEYSKAVNKDEQCEHDDSFHAKYEQNFKYFKTTLNQIIVTNE